MYARVARLNFYYTTPNHTSKCLAVTLLRPHNVQKVFHIVSRETPRTHTAPHRFGQSDISGQSILKSSVQRSIRANLLAQLSIDAETLEQIWPKKENLVLVKWSILRVLCTTNSAD